MNQDTVILTICLVFAFGVVALALGYRLRGQFATEKPKIEIEADPK
jgi:hypothetical protein